MGQAPRIFAPATAFAAPGRGLGSGLSLRHGVPAVGAARLVSTPSRPRPGLARDRHATGFPEFERFYSPGFPRGTQCHSLSPLRMPFRHARFDAPIVPHKSGWRLRSELNRRTRLCRPLHNHSATQPEAHRPDACWSGKPGSNRRPQPWQGYALPTELFPHRQTGALSHPRPALSNAAPGSGPHRQSGGDPPAVTAPTASPSSREGGEAAGNQLQRAAVLQSGIRCP